MSEAGDPTHSILKGVCRLIFTAWSTPWTFGNRKPTGESVTGAGSVMGVLRSVTRVCVDPGKPLVWAEMGYNAWDEERAGAPQEKLDFERNFAAIFTA